MSWTGTILRLLDILPKVHRTNSRHTAKEQEVEPQSVSEESMAIAALRNADQKNQAAGRRLFKTALDEADHTHLVKGQIDRTVTRLEHANRSDQVLATAEAALDLIARGRHR